MRIAVVGAGIAGLSAARRLGEANHEVTVFEKARGVGGRTSTRRSGEASFDHGAQYFTCRGAPFRALCDDLQRRGVVDSWDLPVVALSSGQARPLADPPPRYVGVPGMNALAKELAAPLSVQCRARITRVAPMRDASGPAVPWQLVDDSHAVAAGYDGVVVATPAAQALALVGASEALSNRIRSVEIDPCWAVMLLFAERLDVGFAGAFVADSALAWVARNASKPGRPPGEAWVLHADAAWSRDHLEMPAEAVTKELCRVFEEALGVTVPSPAAAFAHRWRYARPVPPDARFPLWDRERRIGVCGDWTRGARVEDAFESGLELAEEILASGAGPQ